MNKEDCKKKCINIINELFEKGDIYHIDINNYSDDIKEVITTAFHINWDDKEEER